MAQTKIWTVLELLQWTADDFNGRCIETARLDAELLLAHALGCERIDLYLRFDEQVTDDILSSFRDLVKRRRACEPVAYITGIRYFHDISLAVSPAALIPRPETELLVDLAMDRLEHVKSKPARVLDVGTGCGTIALAVAHKAGQARILATDVSPEALDLARDNAGRLGLSERVGWIESDLFEAVPKQPGFDIIISNLPYIPSADVERLMPDVLNYEPRLALDGGENGMELVGRLLEQSPEYLRPNGWVILEIGIGQADVLARRKIPGLKYQVTAKDLSGIKRIIGFSRE